MKQETQNKFAAILAAAQQKANAQPSQPKQEIKQPETIAPEPMPEMPTKVAKMLSFTIIWHEGSGKYDGQTFTSWRNANRAMTAIFNEHDGLGYLKVKVNVKWETGKEITDRVDCSGNGGDFSANRESIGQYLSRQNSVMYASNLQHGERVSLSFEDDAATTEQIPELSETTIADILNEPKYCAPAPFELPTKIAKPEPPKSNLQIVDYSEKAFALIGDTKPIKDILKQLGGRFNLFLSCGAGWIFSKTQLDAVKTKLSL